MLNRAFERYIQGIIDEEELLHLKKTAAYSNALKDFEERVKPNVSLLGTEKYRIAFSGANLTPDASMSLEANAITISRYGRS